MLSKKMAFSLTSLITIFALAFAVPSVMAQDFDATFSAMDVSFAADTQVDASTGTAGSIDVYLTFGHAVTLADVDALFGADAATDGDGGGILNIYNTFGASLDATSHTIAVAARDLDPDGTAVRNDGKSYMLTIAGLTAVPDNDNTNPTKVELFIAEGKINDANPNEDKKNKKGGPFIINLVGADASPSLPMPVSIMLANNLLVPDAGFTGESFQIIVTLSEEPKEGKFTKDHLAVDKGTAADGVFLRAIAPIDGGDDNTDVDAATGRSGMHYQYLVTITPKAEDGDLVIKLNSFEDQNMPTPNRYDPPMNDLARTAGLNQLMVKIKKAVPGDPKKDGLRLNVAEKIIIPASGYLVALGTPPDDILTLSGVVVPGGKIDETPKANERTAAELIYNVVGGFGMPNLEGFLTNGGTIDVESPVPLMISEIMWGTDASLPNPTHSQWIELYNPGDEHKTVNDDAATDANEAVTLVFYGPNETPPAMVKNTDGTMSLPEGVTDRIGTIDAKGAYWSIAGKGQGGRSGVGEAAAELTAVVPTQSLISMYRVMDADGELADGTEADSWMQSTPPGLNFNPQIVGVRIGSPGAARLITSAEETATAAAEKAKAESEAAKAAAAADTSVSMPKVGQIYISEIMFAGGGTLPQWIEISNGSRTEEVNLSGWTLMVENAAADTDVSVDSIKFTIPDETRIDPSGQNDTPSTLLLVTERGRNNLIGAAASGQVIVLNQAGSTTEIELIIAGVLKPRYSLLSDMGFTLTLAPPVPIEPPAKKTKAPTTAAEIAAARAAAAAKAAADAKAAEERKTATDIVGNLGADGTAEWALPTSEDGRSSIIRKHVHVSIGPSEPEDGTMMDGWVLASDTSFAQATHIRAASYYGAQSDEGTPGFRAGGALPVELSHFRPARNKETGAVVITWSTQSELNNAGFFIKRSQQKDGEFTVVNSTMVAGAGTTSEKQFYTYTDTTAQPNVVYYYQIEDVSLDGNRQTLTRGIRLKGHVGAAGKATTTWGDLKTSNE